MSRIKPLKGRLMGVWVALLACALPAAAFAAEPESIEIQSGDLKLRGTLYKPAGSGPFPAVIALHGCAGLGGTGSSIDANLRDWAQRLTEAGFAVIYPDSYGSRGLANQCSVRSRSVRTDRERVADVHAVRTWLLAQPWLNPERMSLLGWSNGGITALWAVRPRLKPADGKPDFRAAAVLYPGCRRLFNAAWSARVPTLILIGGADDWTRPSECQQMVAGAKGRSARVMLHVYHGAYHDFDHPGRRVQLRTGSAFSADGSGRVHVGTHPVARADAHKRVPAWLNR